VESVAAACWHGVPQRKTHQGLWFWRTPSPLEVWVLSAISSSAVPPWHGCNHDSWRGVVPLLPPASVSTDVADEIRFHLQGWNHKFSKKPAWKLNLFFRPWRWRRYIHANRQLEINALHGFISQKILLYRLTNIHYTNLFAKAPPPNHEFMELQLILSPPWSWVVQRFLLRF
jgi:hypothetical protein